ncbi:transcriptional regulator [Roseivirga sp. 4D4]|uniref:ArsR/SmtB family transcription factor n=1 Tax=Roseivirga sp. 4D4 TaxID=1889784 RepID=UPI00085305CC|nr:metalloregulator ArsR/SmtB family transcription factor [Roseivirga sp. 4D4]OEK01048.1 transcriptional regulator [Roseivirga sp. 4D4]
MRRDVFNAIADPTRRDILIALTEKRSNVNALAEKFDMTRQAVSLHVKYLDECGVISIEKEGRERFCKLETKKLAQVADWLLPFKELWKARFNELDHLLENIKGPGKFK